MHGGCIEDARKRRGGAKGEWKMNGGCEGGMDDA